MRLYSKPSEQCEQDNDRQRGNQSGKPPMAEGIINLRPGHARNTVTFLPRSWPCRLIVRNSQRFPPLLRVHCRASISPMGRIRVLSDQVANKIAAGEVVERPASVVKELLENSLDAGATRLRIEVEAGGRRLIRIADDGCGMLRDDALLAFERHATSKLRDVKDLLSISTLGFRGEALPSIASVSRLLLETRSAEEATGACVEIAGGKMLRSEEVALAPGTSITIRDLFFNVPARKKFLRSEQTELAHIASLVTHYSLAHPGKTFFLSSGANELLHATPVTTRRERVFQVFGSGALEELVELGAKERQLSLPEPSVAPSA